MSKVRLSRRAMLSSAAAASAAPELLRAAIAEAQQSTLAQSGLVGEIQGPTMITGPGAVAEDIQ